LSFNTPILLIIYKRPETTKAVAKAILKINPSKVYVFADGSRNEKDLQSVKETRKIIDELPWQGKVIKKYSKKNLGCRVGVSKAITWFFTKEKEGIILEDDCLPRKDFFYFCEELLGKFRNNKNIMQISGNYFLQNGGLKIKESYYFSKYAPIWGWATWRRAWKKYRLQLENTNPTNYDSNEEEKKFNETFDRIRKEPPNTWDYQWLYSIWINNGLCIRPRTELVKNIGFSTGSTHTNQTRHFIETAKSEKLGKLKHPKEILRNIEADELHFKRWFSDDILFKIKDRIKEWQK